MPGTMAGHDVAKYALFLDESVIDRPKCGPSTRRTRAIAARAAKASTAMRASGESCEGRAMRSRNTAETFGAAVGAHVDQRSRRNLAVGRIDHDAHRGKGELMLGGDPGHEMRFHIDRGGAGGLVQLALLGRFGDRLIDADESARGWRRRSDQGACATTRHRWRGRSAIREWTKRPPNPRRADARRGRRRRRS